MPILASEVAKENALSTRVAFEALFMAGRASYSPLKNPPECLKITLLSN
jgi:hypothetical protein